MPGRGTSLHLQSREVNTFIGGIKNQVQCFLLPNAINSITDLILDGIYIHTYKRAWIKNQRDTKKGCNFTGVI